MLVSIQVHMAMDAGKPLLQIEWLYIVYRLMAYSTNSVQYIHTATKSSLVVKKSV